MFTAKCYDAHNTEIQEVKGTSIDNIRRKGKRIFGAVKLEVYSSEDNSTKVLEYTYDYKTLKFKRVK